MGVPIRGGKEEFDRYVAELAPYRRLSAFFLFDDRKSHEPIQEFVSGQFAWLDELASDAQMFFFLPMPESKGLNPSLQIARQLGIAPAELPGIVFFALQEEGLNESGVLYVPVDPEMISGGKSAEDFIADLFGKIFDAERANDPEARLAELKREVESAARSERFVRGPLRWLAATGSSLLQAAAVAFAQGAGSTAAKGGL